MSPPRSHIPEGSSPLIPERPALRDGMVVRERLVNRLRPLRPWTLVSAPAGYGKTVLVDSWAAAVGGGHTVVRMAMDQDAVDPRPFWVYAVDSLAASGVDMSAVNMSSASGQDLRPMVRQIAAHDHDVVLILDTGEFAVAASVCAGLDWVIRRCRDKLSVVLLTRTDPPLALNRYRLEGAITDLRAAELAFTTGEVARLAEGQGLDLTAADTALLHARTGGWPAGLTFALMSLSDEADVSRALEDFRGDTGNVAEYFLSEVLTKQGAASRRFVLRTCVADELDPDLVEALTGQPCDLRMLEAMARSNSFMELVPGRSDRY